MITPNQFRKGSKVEVNGEPFSVVEYLHVKMGRGGANVRTKLKNLLSGNVLEVTFKSGEKIKQPDFEERVMEYLYKDSDNCFFMDIQTYEQVAVEKDTLGEQVLFMPENIQIKVLIFNNNPVGVELPNFIDAAIIKTSPGLKGDTVGGATKDALLDTGAKIQVPLFISEGDVVRVDTRQGIYMERVRSS